MEKQRKFIGKKSDQNRTLDYDGNWLHKGDIVIDDDYPNIDWVIVGINQDWKGNFKYGGIRILRCGREELKDYRWGLSKYYRFVRKKL
jgi:hypothetical protein